jgi:hypothetical protein
MHTRAHASSMHAHADCNDGVQRQPLVVNGRHVRHGADGAGRPHCGKPALLLDAKRSRRSGRFTQ